MTYPQQSVPGAAPKTVATAPMKEIGYQLANPYFWWLWLDETTPELVWPQSTYVYDQMRKTDSQVGSILRAVNLLVLRTPWRVDPAGASKEVTEFVADDLGLPIVGQNPKPPPRTRDRFSWKEHLSEALLMLPLGHSYFEQVYRVDADGKRAHLRKLALRPAKSIHKINVAEDGGLISIEQYWSPTSGDGPMPIPVDRLVGYIHAKEGANWLGTSILRNCYKNWLLKDRLLRVQAQTIERNGMGIPVYKGQEGASSADMAIGLAMATAWRSGESAGSAVPFGASLDLVGVSGTLPDAEPAVRYHDESIAKTVLAHFLNLGQQMGTGSYALGATLGDFFTLGVQTVGQQLADIANCHVVEDLVDINFGEDEPAPRIVFDEIGSRQAATAVAIKSLIDAGVIHPDEVLEESTRQQYGLPPKDPNAPKVPPPLPSMVRETLTGQAPGVPPRPGATPAEPTPTGAMSVAASADDDEDEAIEPWGGSPGDPDPAGPDDGPAEPLGEDVDDLADAILDALDEWVGSQLPADVAAGYHPEELRIPGGKGGGRWTAGGIGKKIADALESWGRGDGPDDPFHVDGKPIDREPLRKAAVARGITLKRGASREDIVAALKGDVRGEVSSARAADNARKSSAKFSITHNGKRVDVAVFTPGAPADRKPVLREVDDAGHPGRIVTSQPDLAGLEKWAGDNGHPDIAGWAEKERGGAHPAAPKAPAKTAAVKAAPTTELADAIRQGGGEGEIVRLLDAHGLPPTQLRDLAAALSIDVPVDARSRQRLQLHIAAEASRKFGLGDGRLADRAPTPTAATPRFDPGAMAERLGGLANSGESAVATQNVVAALGDVTSAADLRRVASSLSLPLPKDRTFTPAELRQYIAENVVRDRYRWTLGGTDPSARFGRVPAKAAAAKVAQAKAAFDADGVRAQLGAPTPAGPTDEQRLAVWDSFTPDIRNVWLKHGKGPEDVTARDVERHARDVASRNLDIENRIRAAYRFHASRPGTSKVAVEDVRTLIGDTSVSPQELDAALSRMGATGPTMVLKDSKPLHQTDTGGRISQEDAWRVMHGDKPMPTSRAAAKVAQAKAAFDVTDIHARLDAATSRDEGRQILSGLSMAQLREVSPAAAAMSGGKTKSDLIESVVGLHVGGRLQFAAIHERTPGDASFNVRELVKKFAPTSPAAAKVAKAAPAKRAAKGGADLAGRIRTGIVGPQEATPEQIDRAAGAVARLSVPQLRQMFTSMNITPLKTKGQQATRPELEHALLVEAVGHGRRRGAGGVASALDDVVRHADAVRERPAAPAAGPAGARVRSMGRQDGLRRLVDDAQKPGAAGHPARETLAKLEADGSIRRDGDTWVLSTSPAAAKVAKAAPAKRAAKAAVPKVAKVASTADTIQAGKFSAKPLDRNTWGGLHGPVHVHPDDQAMRAIDRMGADAKLDVNGEPLGNVVGRIVTKNVTGAQTTRESVDQLKALRDRLPQGPGRQELDGIIAEMDGPTAHITVPAGTPEPLQKLAGKLSQIPLANVPAGGRATEVEKLQKILDGVADGSISPLRLEMALRSEVLNQRHESQGSQGKLEIDRAVTDALTELRAIADERRKAKRDESSPAATKVAKAAPAKRAAKAAAPVSVTKGELSAMTSRDQAAAALSPLKKAELVALAEQSSIPGARSKSQAELRRLIVEATVGFRLDADARSTYRLPY